LPIYVFRDPLTGTAFEEILSVPDRDKPVIRHGRLCHRVTAPERIFVASGQPSPLDARAGALRGYQRLEQRGQLRRSDYNHKTIKSTWS